MQEFWTLPIPSPVPSERVDGAAGELTDTASPEMTALARQLTELERMRDAIRQFSPLEVQLIGTVLRLAKLASEPENHQTVNTQTMPLLAELSKREHEVLELMLEGKSNREAAEILRISPRTVEVHRSRVMSKADAPNAVALANKIFSSRGERQHAELNEIIQSARESLRERIVESVMSGADVRRAAEMPDG